MKIPFVDLQTQFKSLRKELLAGIEAVCERSDFILGEDVRKLEADFARYTGSAFGVGVASGLDALHLALRAVGVTAGDEVLVPAHTFIATALAVTHAGGRPVPVDVVDGNFSMNAQAAEKAVTKRTKAILPVHLYGRMMDLGPLSSLAQKRKLFLIEDAAQAHGAKLGAKRAGAVGHLGCFSFYPGKNLGGYGDGGFITTDEPIFKSKLEALRNCGAPKKHFHPVVGFNSRLDTVQAAILGVKLPHLDAWNGARRAIAAKYNRALKGVGDLVLPELPADESHVFHLYVVRTKKRDALAEALGKAGVATGLHYPTPIHLHGAYSWLGFKRGDFPVAEKLCDEVLSLPIYPELTDEQLSYVVKQVKGFY